MISMPLSQIADVTGGLVADADPGLQVSAPASIDSRTVPPGGLFVAVRGEHADGHDFAAAAIHAGATACLTGRAVGVPAVVVPDSVTALGRLAAAVRARLSGCNAVGITGSQGKTGTKDMLRHVLARSGDTVAAAGSYNNELGVPLTVLTATPGTRHLVVEMGARSRGHVAYLCGIAQPRVGVVLNVGVAHLGEFGSREAIAAAKGELVEALPAAGTAVLNCDDPMVNAMAGRTAARVFTFGANAGADVSITGLRLDPHGRPRFTLRYEADTVEVALALLGEHAAGNAAAAAAVALLAGMRLDDVAAALSSATATSRWRMERRERSDGVVVLNDAYNANPDSVRAALRTLVAVTDQAATGRSIAVLGQMLELGDSSEAQHDATGRLAARLGVDLVLVVGEQAGALHRGASREHTSTASVLVPDTGAAVTWLDQHVQPHDVVLVKASRAVGLESVAAALLGDETGSR